MTNENILCSMTGYYHDRIMHESDILLELDKDLLSDILRYRVDKPASSLKFNRDQYVLGETVPIRANLIINNTTFSVDGVTTVPDLLDPNSPSESLVFPGEYVSEWDDLYDYYLIRHNCDEPNVIYRAIIRGICNYFAGIKDCSNFQTSTLYDCQFTLGTVLCRYVGIHKNTDIRISDKLFYWYGDGCIHICILCKCQHRTLGSIFVPKEVPSTNIMANDFLRTVFNTFHLFQNEFVVGPDTKYISLGLDYSILG